MRKFLLAATVRRGFYGLRGRSSEPGRPAPITTTYVPVFTWTGFYVGVNAGYGWTQSNNVTFTTPTGLWTTYSSGNNSGFTGGGQIGYNMQYNQFVFGLETDIQYADFGKKNYYSTGLGPFPTFATDNGNYFGTVRGRVGYAIDRTLIYVTGGLAYGDVGQTVGNASTNWGWTLGGGVEYALLHQQLDCQARRALREPRPRQQFGDLHQPRRHRLRHGSCLKQHRVRRRPRRPELQVLIGSSTRIISARRSNPPGIFIGELSELSRSCYSLLSGELPLFFGVCD